MVVRRPETCTDYIPLRMGEEVIQAIHNNCTKFRDTCSSNCTL
jgi:hypothetical protein